MSKLDELDVDTADLARALSLTRVLIGTAAFVAPKRFARAWTGDAGSGPATSMAMRGLGIRDVALGLGTLLAIERGRGARSWLEACALADAGDALGTLAAFGDLPGLRRFAALATAATGTYIGLSLAEAIDQD